MNEILNVLPANILRSVHEYDVNGTLQEIRLKVDTPVIINANDKEYVLPYKLSNIEIRQILQKISGFSVYAYDDEIREGFITAKGGCRIGISGEFSSENGRVKSLKNIYSLNIRIARQIKGCSDKIMKYICNNGSVLNTILISPPKCGKTTIIRDIARNLSNGMDYPKIKGMKVAIIDERSEIAACNLGIPQMDVGIRTDVFDRCFKSEGIMMAVRSMSPDVIVCDEIGTKEDMEAIQKSFLCGISIITTIHGKGVEDIFRREAFNQIIRNNILQRAIILDNKGHVGHVSSIYDFSKGEEIMNG